MVGWICDALGSMSMRKKTGAVASVFLCFVALRWLNLCDWNADESTCAAVIHWCECFNLCLTHRQITAQGVGHGLGDAHIDHLPDEFLAHVFHAHRWFEIHDAVVLSATI